MCIVNEVYKYDLFFKNSIRKYIKIFKKIMNVVIIMIIVLGVGFILKVNDENNNL